MAKMRKQNNINCSYLPQKEFCAFMLDIYILS